MPRKVTALRRTVWYQRFKHFAGDIEKMGTADILRATHRVLNVNMLYGSRTIAAGAHDSVEQVIQDLKLDGAMPLGNRLAHITAEAYGKSITATELLNHASDEDLVQLFSSVYEGLLQEGILE